MKDAKKQPSREDVNRQKRAEKRSKDILRQRKREEAALKKRVRNINKEYTIVSGFFVLIFLSLIAYVIYFNVEKSQEFINSPYNTRQNTFADRVIRGTIESSDGEILAYTNVHPDGTEERIYPYSRIFAHAVGYDSNGKSGLESEANFQLLSNHSFLIRQIKNQLSGKKDMGDTVVSTLDYTIQNTAYQALGERKGAIIAIEPSTGRILCMVSKPDFDPNTLEADWEYYINNSDSSNLLNRVTNGQYPPGSVFKMVTTLDYMRTKGYLNNFSYQCEGSVTKSEHTIRCYNGNVHGGEDLNSAFANSCNTAFASMGVELGGASLRRTSENLMFNHKLPYTGAKRSVFSLDENSGVPLIMQTAIGQGNTLVSPMHMALLTAAVANHGVLMEPHLIDYVKNDEGITISKKKPEVYRRLMTNREAEYLGTLMRGVVTNGTASSLSGKSYSTAGKTGSAEFDSNGSSHSWFVGYCNAENPDMVVAVIVENGGTGSQAAVPIAGQLFDAYYLSQAAQDAKKNHTIDYSYYDEDTTEHNDNGWFDIVEEDYQEFDQEEYEDWEQIYEQENETDVTFPIDPEPEQNETDPDISYDDDNDWEEPPYQDELPDSDNEDPWELEWFEDPEASEEYREAPYSEEESFFTIESEEQQEY